MEAVRAASDAVILPLDSAPTATRDWPQRPRLIIGLSLPGSPSAEEGTERLRVVAAAFGATSAARTNPESVPTAVALERSPGVGRRNVRRVVA